MNAKRTVAKNAAWLSLQPLLMNVLSIAATRYIAGRLGVADFGRFNLGLAFVATFAPLTNLGLRTVTARHVPTHRDTAAEYLGQVLVLRTLLAVVIALVAILAAPLSGGSGETQVVIAIAAAGLVITTIAGVITDGFQAFERVGPVGMANSLGGVVLTLASVAAVRWGGLRALALAYALGPICTLTLLCYWSRGVPFRPRLCWHLPTVIQLIRQASPFVAIMILDAVSARIDVLALARMQGEGHLGCYTAAMSLVVRLMYLTDGAASALLPALAHLSAHAPEATVPLLRKSALWLLMLTLPLAILITATSPLIVKLIFGGQYAAAAVILAIGVWRLPAMCLTMLAGQSLFSVSRQDLELRTAAVGTLMYMVLVLPLARYFGSTGGALAFAACPLLPFLLRMPAMRRYVPSFWPWGQLARVSAAIVLMSLPLAFVPRFGLCLQSLGLVLAAGGLYVAGLELLGVVSARPLWHELRRRARKDSGAVAWAAGAAPRCD